MVPTTTVMSSMGPIAGAPPNITANMTTAAGMAHMSPNVQHLQAQAGSPGMPPGPMTPVGMPPGGMHGMPPTPVMTPNSSSNMSHGVVNGGMAHTPGGMPHTPGGMPLPNIVPSPQMVGAAPPHHPVSSASYPSSVMLNSGPTPGMKPPTPHAANFPMKPPTPSMIMNPRTPKTPQGSVGQPTNSQLTSPALRPAPSPRSDGPQVAPSPQATLNGNYNSPAHTISRSPNTSGYDGALLPNSNPGPDPTPYSISSPFSPHSNLSQTLTPLTEPIVS